MFYAQLTGGVTKGSEHWATVVGPNGFIAFQQVDDLCPAVWPGAEVPMQMHLDFFVDDLEATGARAVAAGATVLDLQPNSDHCVVYADRLRAFAAVPQRPAGVRSGSASGSTVRRYGVTPAGLGALLDR